MGNEYQMYTEMLSLLNQYEEKIYSEWCNGLAQACSINLSQPLISRCPLSGLISVNFNPKVFDTETKKHFDILCPECKNIFNIFSNWALLLNIMYTECVICFSFQLTEILKDVKYLRTVSQINIPAAAIAVFEKRDMFTKVKLTFLIIPLE